LAKTNPSRVNVQQARAEKDSGVQPRAGDVGTGVGQAARGKDRAAEQVTGDTIEVDGKKRPTTNSNGRPIETTREKLRNFWRFFGDSKVVDADGNPLVVYHGTTENFGVFDIEKSGASNRFGPGFYFTTDKRTFDTYGGREGGNVMPVFLSIKNPQTGSALTETQIKKFFSALKDKVFPNGYDATDDQKKFEQSALDNPSKAFDILLSAQTAYISKADWLRGMDAIGVDGIVREVFGYPEYVVFSPTQIKSATGNEGTYSEDAVEINRVEKEIGDTIEVDGKKRPTTNSNGRLIETTREKLRNFWRWFSNSKLVDKSGEPIVLYHSTYSDVDRFKTNFGTDEYRKFGAHLGTLEAAQNRLSVKTAEDQANRERSGTAAANVMPVYASIKNPLRLDENRSGRWGVDDIMRAIMGKAENGEFDEITADDVDDYFRDGFDIEAWLGVVPSPGDANYDSGREERFWSDDIDYSPGERSDLLKAFIQQLGYDGIVYANEFEGGGDSYIALDSKQVKSATGNIGTYSGDAVEINMMQQEGFQFTKAPDWVPQKIWTLHEKHRLADLEASGTIAVEGANGEGKSPGALRRNQTMAFRRLNKAVEDYVGKDWNNVNDLMVRMNEESARRDDEAAEEINMMQSPIADPDAVKGEGKKAIDNSRESILYQPVDGTWNTPMDPKPLKLSDEFFYNWVDKQVDLKRVVDAIKETGKRVAGKFNALERERTYHGRVAKRTQDYLTNELQPTIELMKKYGITQREMGEYLLNRHAPEANKVIAERNPRFPDAGSSVKTSDAIKYMQNLDPLRKRQLDAVATRMDKTLTKMQDMLVKYGIETQDTIDGWRDMFQYYIPLVRDDADYSINKVMSQGAGYSRSGDTAKSRTGSAKEVNLDEIFSNIAMQHERMIVRAEGNRVGQAVFGLALTQPNPGFWLALDPETNVIWKTIKELEDIKADRDLIKEMLDSGDLSPSQEAEYRMELDLIRKIIKKKEQPARSAFAKARDDVMELGFNPEEATKLVEQLMMPPMKARYNKDKNEVVYEPNAAVNNEFVFATRVNGSDKFVLFNGNDERANRMARALKNMDAENLSAAMNIAAKITRFFAAINTQYNPVFGAYNFLRDLQTAALQISTTDIADKRKDVINGTPAALKAIFQVARARRDGKKVTGELAKDFEEFENEGGQTGFRDQFSQSAERAEAIQRMIDPSSWASSPLGKFFTAGGKLKVPMETMRKGAAPLFDFLSDL